MKNVAIILAGGSGRRMGSAVPKQFLLLNGRMVIAHTLDVFERCPAVDEIAIVAPREHLERTRELLKAGCWSKVSVVIEGGSERYRSSMAAIEHFRDRLSEVNLLFHDAVRAMLPSETLERVCAELLHHRAVGVALASVDTVWQVDTDTQTLHSVPPRSSMFMAQTPQAFRGSIIDDAYRRAMASGDTSLTDEAGAMLRYRPDVKLHVVEGDARNIKITRPEDLRLAELLLSSN